MRNLSCFLLGLFLFVLLINPAKAQTPPPSYRLQVTGQLRDSVTNEAISFATVTLSKKAEKAIVAVASSGNDGHFSLNYKGAGSYLFTVRSLSSRAYQKEIALRQDTVIGLGKIALSELSKMLDVVTVKPLVEQTADKITYNLSMDPDRAKISLSDALAKVPLVHMEPDGKMYIGSPEKSFVVVRNGRRDAVFGDNLNYVLQNIPANGFSKVEVVLSPSTRYGNADYVLNIVTDNSMKVVGAVGNITERYSSINNSNRTNPGTTFSSEKLRGNVDADFSFADAPGSGSSTERQTYSTNSVLKQEESNRNKSDNYETKGSFSYDLAKNQFVASRLSWKTSDSKSSKLTSSETRVNDLITKQYTINDGKNTDGNSLEVAIDYEFEFKKPNRIFNASFLLNNTENNKNSFSFYDGVVGYTDRYGKTINEDRTSEKKLQLSYSDAINKKFTLESGASLLFRHYYTSNNYFNREFADALWVKDTAQYRLMDKAYWVLDGYLSLKYVFNKKLSLNGSIKSNYLDDGKGTLIGEGNSQKYISETNFIFNPSLGVKWLVNKTNLSFSYQISQLRPSLSQLNPINYQPYAEIITVGNPELKPQLDHTLLISSSTFSKVFSGISLRTLFSNNAIASYWYKNELGQTVSTYLNYGKTRSISISTNGFLPVSNRFRPRFSGMLGYSEMTTPQQQKNQVIHAVCVVNSSYRFKNGLYISFTPSYTYLFNKGYNYSQPRLFNTPMSMSKAFFKNKVFCSLSTQNLIWNSINNIQYVNAPDYYLKRKDTASRYDVNFTLSYRFGKFKVKPIRDARKKAEINDLTP